MIGRRLVAKIDSIGWPQKRNAGFQNFQKMATNADEAI